MFYDYYENGFRSDLNSQEIESEDEYGDESDEEEYEDEDDGSSSESSGENNNNKIF